MDLSLRIFLFWICLGPPYNLPEAEEAYPQESPLPDTLPMLRHKTNRDKILSLSTMTPKAFSTGKYPSNSPVFLPSVPVVTCVDLSLVCSDYNGSKAEESKEQEEAARREAVFTRVR